MKYTRRIDTLIEPLKALGMVGVKESQGLISLIGCHFKTVNEMQQFVFSAVEDINPNLISYSKSKSNLNIALNETELVPAVVRIPEALFCQGAC